MYTQNLTIIDILITIVDNYGDMGFAMEFALALHREYPEQYLCILWVDDLLTMRNFAKKSWREDIQIADIQEFWKLRKSAICVSILHAPIPDVHLFTDRALILRIDYLSLDPLWISHNGWEHIRSTRDRQIIELIPSPLLEGAGLIPRFPSERRYARKTPHISVFVYPDTLSRIDFDSFPEDMTIYIFGRIESHHPNVIVCEFLSLEEFYAILDSSGFVIIRWEVSFAHVIQSWVPFFWDMYKRIGGFPGEQSSQFLDMIWASHIYRQVHGILNWKSTGTITYQDMIESLSHTSFTIPRIQNLIHTVKKHIDRFHNSI